ncbi:hypothetical protein V3C99_015655, partial [Haemonchus contortus]
GRQNGVAGHRSAIVHWGRHCERFGKISRRWKAKNILGTFRGRWSRPKTKIKKSQPILRTKIRKPQPIIKAKISTPEPCPRRLEK